ncbi:hypothetical protein L1887_60948 [Cichorium endivia]|nr:hypothetical protein L1887_60948 [Cichorium endivia]
MPQPVRDFRASVKRTRVPSKGARPTSPPSFGHPTRPPPRIIAIQRLPKTATRPARLRPGQPDCHVPSRRVLMTACFPVPKPSGVRIAAEAVIDAD